MRSALGFIGWSTDDFYAATIPEFKQALDGRMELEKTRVRAAWERTRTLAMYVAGPYSKNPIERPQDLWLFDDEKIASRPDNLDERSKRLIDKWDAEMAERFSND